MDINFNQQEVSIKIVYYGPGLSGKTTNLEIIHARTSDLNRGKLTAVATNQDRTLFFDYMPIELGKIRGMKIKLRLFTVPGQVCYNMTRKLVLRSVDGLVFVADSQKSKEADNLESLQNLKENLEEQKLSLENIPLVLQFNKRDLPDLMSMEYMAETMARPLGVQYFPAIAMKGEGVFPCLKAIANLTMERIGDTEKKRTAGVAAQPARVQPVVAARQPAPPQAPAAPVEEPAAPSLASGMKGIKLNIPRREASAPFQSPFSSPSAPVAPAMPPPEAPKKELKPFGGTRRFAMQGNDAQASSAGEPELFRGRLSSIHAEPKDPPAEKRTLSAIPGERTPPFGAQAIRQEKTPALGTPPLGSPGLRALGEPSSLSHTPNPFSKQPRPAGPLTPPGGLPSVSATQRNEVVPSPPSSEEAEEKGTVSQDDAPGSITSQQLAEESKVLREKLKGAKKFKKMLGQE